MTESSDPIHPGKILYEQAMQPLGVSRNKLARDIDVPVGRISDIVAGKRGITPDTALRLGKYFGTSAEMWMQFQTDFDLFVSRNSAWRDIAPRVRELQPIDPDAVAVAPVTAMDQHAEMADDADPTSRSPDRPAAEQSAPVEPGPAESQAPGDASEEGEEKWWLVPFSDSAEDAPAVEPDAEPEDTDISAETVAAEPEGVDAPEDDASGTEQTFEIDVRPAAAASQVVADGEPADEAAPPPRPQRRYTVEVVREATQPPEPDADDPGAPEDADAAAAASEPIDEDGFTIELNEDDFDGELPGDAFASELDDQAVEERRHEYYAPVIARTGTDDFASLDPPIAGAEATTGIGDLTPANWSSALESARRDEPEFGDPATPRPASADDAAGPAISGHFDVPLPSEFEPAKEGHLPPWPPADADDPSASLDIPEPENARKLYEYDD